MTNSHAITELVEQRAKISGLILDLEKDLAGHRASLLHIDATIKLLDPSIKIHTIRAKHRMADRSGYFAVGELSKRCLDAIRQAGEHGVSAEEISLVTMRAKGISEGDDNMRRDFIRRFHWAMGRLQRDGRIDRLGHGRGVRWKGRE